MFIILVIIFILYVFFDFLEIHHTTSLQTHHMYSTLKQRGNGGFHAVSTWNTRVMFVGKILNTPLHVFNLHSTM